MAVANSFYEEARNRPAPTLFTILLITAIIAWQPVHILIQQQSQIDATTSAINTLNQQRMALVQQSHDLENPAAIAQLARQQYQLVRKGQQLIQVLPEARAGVSALDAADPARDPLVSPSNVMSLFPHASLTTTTTHRSGFWTRLKQTLEFWR